jgi:hypothetical protein
MARWIRVSGAHHHGKERASELSGRDRSRMRKHSEFGASPVGSDSDEPAIAYSGSQNYKGVQP